MSESRQNNLAKRMRWAARVIGLFAATLCLVMLIGQAVAEIVTEGWKVINADIVAGILIGVLRAIGLAGCIVSWWRERLAAILLVLTAVGFGIHIGICAGRNHFLVWLIIGLPYLVAGILIINQTTGLRDG